MKTKIIGIILIIITIILILILLSFTLQSQEQAKASCSCIQEGQECSMQVGLPWQSYLGFLFVAIILILGIYLFIKKEEKGINPKVTKKLLSQLDKDEKKIYQLILNAQGTIFQSELVEKSGFSKVKVTRILDKLEGKKLIERRRRGMTNVVIMK